MVALVAEDLWSVDEIDTVEPLVIYIYIYCLAIKINSAGLPFNKIKLLTIDQKTFSIHFGFNSPTTLPKSTLLTLLFRYLALLTLPLP